VVTFTNKRNRNQVIKVTKNSDGRITEIDNPTGVRFAFSVGQLLIEMLKLGQVIITSNGW
jgi:hypothetical protein